MNVSNQFETLNSSHEEKLKFSPWGDWTFRGFFAWCVIVLFVNLLYMKKCTCNKRTNEKLVIPHVSKLWT